MPGMLTSHVPRCGRCAQDFTAKGSFSAPRMKASVNPTLQMKKWCPNRKPCSPEPTAWVANRLCTAACHVAIKQSETHLPKCKKKPPEPEHESERPACTHAESTPTDRPVCTHAESTTTVPRTLLNPNAPTILSLVKPMSAVGRLYFLPSCFSNLRLSLPPSYLSSSPPILELLVTRAKMNVLFSRVGVKTTLERNDPGPKESISV